MKCKSWTLQNKPTLLAKAAVSSFWAYFCGTNEEEVKEKRNSLAFM